MAYLKSNAYKTNFKIYHKSVLLRWDTDLAQ
jgi:hypothetical protein